MLTAELFHEGKVPMQQIGGKEGGGCLLEGGVFLGAYVIRLLCTHSISHLVLFTGFSIL